MNHHYEVLIIGAGVAGVGLACHLARGCPGKSYAILERRQDLGGTWDLFRYPGIRSDSDIFTFGYNFKPWKSAKTLADGPAIKQYIAEAAAEHGVDKNIVFGRNVIRSNWSSQRKLWEITATDTQTGEEHQYTARFLLACTGYYDYAQGHQPQFPGQDQFQGHIIHPQHWPEDLDYRGKTVVVIGSGATAVTLVPAMAKDAAHVTMLQRSPSYIFSQPAVNPAVVALQKTLPTKVAYRLARAGYVNFQRRTYELARKRPRLMRWVLQKAVQRALNNSVDMKHFTPTYEPWDERLCAVPDGDLFEAMRHGKAAVETDTIQAFTTHGVQLQSGRELQADIVVTATGLTVQVLGGGELLVDGQPVPLAERLTYKHMLVEGVPNALMVFGYVNASYTLRVDLSGEYLCRLLQHMDRQGYATVRAQAPADQITQHSIFSTLKSGYLQRGEGEFPRQGLSGPWRVSQNYLADREDIAQSPIDNPALNFERMTSPALGPETTNRTLNSQPAA